MEQAAHLVQKKQRDSSIELLKIIAMFAIVISHVTQTLLPPEGGDRKFGL